MKYDARKHSNMPNIMAAAHIIEPPRKEALGHFTRIQQRASHVHNHALCDRRVEVLRPLDAAGVRKLAEGQEAGQCKRDIE